MIGTVTRVFTLAEELAGERSERLRRGLALGALEAVFGAVPYVCLYFVLRDLFHDEVTVMRAAWLTAIMFGALAVQAWLGVHAMISIMTASYELFGQVRMRMAEHVRQVPLGWVRSEKSGALAEAMTGLLDLLSEIWSHFIGYLSGGVAIPICVGVFLLFVDWRLGLVVRATLPAAFMALAVVMSVMRPLAKKVGAAIMESNHQMVEYIRGIQVLRVFGRFGEGLERMERAADEQRRAMVRIETWTAPAVGVYGATIDAGFAVMLYIGAWFVLGGQLDGDILLLFIVVGLKFFQPLYDLGVALLLLKFGQQALEGVEGVFAVPTLAEPEHEQVPTRFDIAFDSVRFRYEEGEGEALTQVSATMPERTMTAIVGPSGAGKSTMAHLIPRLWDVTDGAVRVGGVDVREMTTAELHKHVSMVFQDVTLFDGTVRDNLLLGRPDATEQEMIEAAKGAQAHDFIMKLPQGYDTPLGAGGERLSGGEKQRISIARALLKDAPIVLLDEATASIDPAAEVHIQRAIDALVKERTVVVIAHRLRTIARADKIVVLEDGRVAEQGSHGELLAAGGLYAALWFEQQAALGRTAQEDAS